MVCLAGCGGGSNGGSGGGGGTGGGTGGGGSSTTVTYTFTGGTPTAVATQIGTGAYTQASLQSGALTLSIPSGTTNYSVAYVCPTSISSIENVIDASIEDGTSFTEICNNWTAPQSGLATLQVNASAIPGASEVDVVWGSDYTYAQPWSGDTLSFSDQMTAGTYDVFVVVYDSTGEYPLAVRILRSQTVPGALNGGNPVVFAASDETVTQTITYDNLPAGSSPFDPPVVDFFTSDGQELELEAFPMVTPATQYPAMPTGAVQSGDYYTFDTSASGGAAGGTVSASMATASGGPQTFTFPAPWSYPGPTAAALPTFSFSYTGFSGKPSVVQEATITWTLGILSGQQIQMRATASYQSGATSITIPDLSGLTGFIAPAPSGTLVVWSAEIQQGSAFQTTPPNGTVQSVANAGAYIEP